MSTAQQSTIPTSVHPLTLDFLRWVAEQPRSYEEAMEAWRTNCPRLSIWEDALADGLVVVERNPDMTDNQVAVTPRGRALLDQT